MLFARGVILVEGASELYLIPAIAKSLRMDLDMYGITVCSIHGTHFSSYVKLLGPSGLNIPFVILTDGDSRNTNVGGLENKGLGRAARLAMDMGHAKSELFVQSYNSKQWEKAYRAAFETGIFVGRRTLEVDFFEVGNRQVVVDTLQELGASDSRVEHLQSFVGQGGDLSDNEAEIFMKAVEGIGKVSVAQRLAGKSFMEEFPNYIRQGITHLVKKVS